MAVAGEGLAAAPVNAEECPEAIMLDLAYPAPARWRLGLKKGRRGPAGKRAVVALVERGGEVRTFHVAVADASAVVRIVRDNLNKESRLHTDESGLYTWIGTRMAAHETVKHSAVSMWVTTSYKHG